MVLEVDQMGYAGLGQAEVALQLEMAKMMTEEEFAAKMRKLD